MNLSSFCSDSRIYDAHPPHKEDPFNFHFSSLVSEPQDTVLQEARSLLAQWSESTATPGITSDQFSHLHINNESRLESKEIKRAVAGMVGNGTKIEKRKKLAADPSVVMAARQIIRRENIRASGPGRAKPIKIQDRAVKK
jgi:hypothetical protein